MLKVLYENPEIRNFLTHFDSHDWIKAIECVALIGIRTSLSQKFNLTLEGLEELTNRNSDIKKTIKYLKLEVKSLNSSIKKIEKKSQSSRNVLKDYLGDTNKVIEHFKKDAVIEERFLKLEEPRICNMKDAQKIIKNIKSPQFADFNEIKRKKQASPLRYFNTRKNIM